MLQEFRMPALGADMENNLRRALSISNGDFWYLVQSPIAASLYTLTALILLTAFVMAFRTSRRRRLEAVPEVED